jgi:hypothetical protein
MAASIPIIHVVLPSSSHAVASSVLGSLVVVVESFLQAFEFQRYWIRYRQGHLALEREKFLFESSAGPYRGIESPEMLFAERSENVIAATQASWLVAIDQTTGANLDRKSLES